MVSRTIYIYVYRTFNSCSSSQMLHQGAFNKKLTHTLILVISINCLKSGPIWLQSLFLSSEGASQLCNLLPSVSARYHHLTHSGCVKMDFSFLFSAARFSRKKKTQHVCFSSTEDDGFPDMVVVVWGVRRYTLGKHGR